MTIEESFQQLRDIENEIEAANLKKHLHLNRMKEQFGKTFTCNGTRYQITQRVDKEGLVFPILKKITKPLGRPRLSESAKVVYMPKSTDDFLEEEVTPVLGEVDFSATGSDDFIID